MAAHFPHEASGATMRYSSRCEKVVLFRFLNNSQKNIKKSVAQEMCWKRKYSRKIENVFILQN